MDCMPPPLRSLQMTCSMTGCVLGLPPPWRSQWSQESMALWWLPGADGLGCGADTRNTMRGLLSFPHVAMAVGDLWLKMHSTRTCRL